MSGSGPSDKLGDALDAAGDRFAMIRTFAAAALAASIQRDLDELEHVLPLLKQATADALAISREAYRAAKGTRP